MLGQRSGRIILGNPEAGNATVIRLLQQPKGGAGYCDSLDILLQWNSAPFTAGDAIPLSIQIKGAGLVIRAFLSRFEIPRPRPSSKAHLHLYRDAVVAQTEADDLYRDVLDVVDRKNEEVQRQRDQEKLAAEATEKAKELGNTKEAKTLIDKAKKEAEKLSKQTPIDPVLWKRVRKYLRENKKAKPTELVWSVNFDELKKAVEFMGCRAIRSNVESDPFKALQIYRQREIIERGFDQLKNEVGGSRLEATEATYRGKLFIYTIAQALRMSMLCTARKISDQNPSLKMPEESLRKLLGQLRSVQARKHRTTDAFIVGAVAKRHRDLLDLLGIEKLPGYINR